MGNSTCGLKKNTSKLIYIRIDYSSGLFIKKDISTKLCQLREEFS